MNSRLYLVIAGALMFTAVALGAFGAHALREVLTERGKEVYATASHYHFYHGLALLIVPLLTQNGFLNTSSSQVVFYLLLAGIVIFSGSLYLLAVSGQTWLGAVTPVGGVLLLAGWGWLLLSAVSRA